MSYAGLCYAGCKYSRINQIAKNCNISTSRTLPLIQLMVLLQSTKIPGIMFLMCGALSTISVLTVLGLDETRKANLADKIPERRMKVQTDKDEDEIAVQTNLSEVDTSI